MLLAVRNLERGNPCVKLTKGAEEPQLIKISATVYGCSKCPDFKIVKPDKKTARATNGNSRSFIAS